MAIAVVFTFHRALGSQSAQTSSPPAETTAPIPQQAEQTSPPSFEVASIRKFAPGSGPRYPMHGMGAADAGRWRAVGISARSLIIFAYGLQPFQVSGGPAWIDGEEWNIDAKVDDATAAQWQNMTRQEQSKEMLPMLQTLLRNRFKLQVTRGNKRAPAYALVIAKGGPKLKESAPGESPIASFHVGPVFAMAVKGSPISSLAGTLALQLKKTVLDQTGLTGKYDIDLQFEAPGALSTDTSAADPAAESIFDALQDQLGLKLISTTAPMEMLTIDHIEEPTPD